ncbi:MAG: hypothetical protein CMF78_02250 [Candidatus Marinimicrobia bacterium]|nr:hypothetical protein [Candidatus Neomarinimicrobiota bacterium]
MIISSAFSGNFGVDIALIWQLPKGEFKDEGVPTGFGLDINGLWYPSNILGFGINLGGTRYGSSERPEPWSNTIPDFVVTVKTTNDLVYGHLLARVVPLQGEFRPYFEGLLGMKNLFTSTKVISEYCPGDDDTCELAISRNYTDYAFSYGCGGGLEITLTSFGGDEDSDFKGGEDSGIEEILSFFINARYMIGDEAEYLKEGDIHRMDQEPYDVTYSPSTSKTDVLQISLGLNFNF